ncbi:hypothetical protein PVK06_044104 [Gossypium arboreum]|uniref:Retrotransposon gag domain-containing protein n=1 Tax=Gossypium arboreum TaxID=29729 RepID=A0ABR0MQP7_GOSAR|nr:hypothetical protein PVK06_044104 [Gossypium arboreum]
MHLIIENYELTGFLEGTLSTPPRFVTSPEGSLVPNSEASAFVQQNRLLASWLISPISPSLLPSFTDALMACDVWNTATWLFAAVTGAKLSRIRHDLHSLKKGTLSISQYVAKIQNICILIEAFGSQISEVEKVEVVLASLTLEFDVVLTIAFFSIETLPFQQLVDVLLEYETRLTRAVQDLPLQANLVESALSSTLMEPSRGGCSSFGSRGRGFKSHIQC